MQVLFLYCFLAFLPESSQIRLRPEGIVAVLCRMVTADPLAKNLHEKMAAIP